MQLTDTMVTPSTTAWPVAGSSGYVASPSISDMASPESATAPRTASSACAASGTSAERVTREKPTPLTATSHRCSHMRRVSSGLLRVALEAELRQRELVVQWLEDHLDAASHLRLGAGRLQEVGGQQGARRVVELHDDARVGDGCCEALVAGVVHDRVRVDGAPAADRLERQIGRHAAHAGRIRWMLEVTAALAALQLKLAAPGRVPERLRPLVWDRDWAGHPASVRQRFAFRAGSASWNRRQDCGAWEVRQGACLDPSQSWFGGTALLSSSIRNACHSRT